MEHTLGILITYHNEQSLLTECLESLLAQSVQIDEILIYDDASAFPAQDYMPDGFGIRVVRGEQNIGPARARNILLHASRSEYVHFHDADDLFLPAWSTQIHAKLDERRWDAVFTEIRSTTEEGQLLCERVLGLTRLSEQRVDLVQFCIAGPVLSPSGTYKRASIVEIGGYRESLWQSEDYDFHVRLAASGISFTIIDSPLVQIRVRADSRSQNQREVWSSTLKALHLWAQELPSFYSQDIAETAARVGSILFQLGERDKAREAFALAQHLGPPRLPSHHRWYRMAVSLFGLENTEMIGRFYRSLLPSPIRAALARVQ